MVPTSSACLTYNTCDTSPPIWACMIIVSHRRYTTPRIPEEQRQELCWLGECTTGPCKYNKRSANIVITNTATPVRPNWLFERALGSKTFHQLNLRGLFMIQTKMYGCLGRGHEKAGQSVLFETRSSSLKQVLVPSLNTLFLCNESIRRAL
jgi:hypothetical protein